MALNNTATYLGLAASGVLGGASLLFIDRHDLGFVGAGLIALALVCAEGAQRFMLRRQGRRHALQPLATR
jgi:predicted MFS family arabinose efflux permease